MRLDKLAKITGELERFARQLANDSGISVKPEEWIARDFYNSSVGATIEYIGESVPAHSVHTFNEGLAFFAGFSPERASGLRHYSSETLKRFVDLGDALDVGEVIKLGLIDDDHVEQPRWEEISKRATLDVDDAIRNEVLYEGSVQGKLGTWYKGSNYFNLNETSLGAIVKCFYPISMYDDVHRVYEDKDAVVHVLGTVKADRATGKPKEIRVSQIKVYPPLSDDDFGRVFGIAPNLTGRESTKEYLDKVRGDEDS